ASTVLPDYVRNTLVLMLAVGALTAVVGVGTAWLVTMHRFPLVRVFAEALTMSTRIAVFDDGIIQQLAEPSVLYEKPENAFVAAFIGENNK
ncbi:hypothetical protein SB717_35835, partial [Priestia sp. SIMBA_032]